MANDHQTQPEQNSVMPALPDGWFLASIIVRRDRGWCYGGSLTYDALLERDGGYYEARGERPDPVAAVRAAVAAISAR